MDLQLSAIGFRRSLHFLTAVGILGFTRLVQRLLPEATRNVELRSLLVL